MVLPVEKQRWRKFVKYRYRCPIHRMTYLVTMTFKAPRGMTKKEIVHRYFNIMKLPCCESDQTVIFVDHAFVEEKR